MELAQLLNTDRVHVWAGFLLFAGGFLNLLLMYPLNGRFDRDWIRAPASERFFMRFMRTLEYSGAVVWSRGKRVIFGDTDYDFRGRVSTFLYVLCLLNQLLAATAVLAMFLGVGLSLRDWIMRR